MGANLTIEQVNTQPANDRHHHPCAPCGNWTDRSRRRIERGSGLGTQLIEWAIESSRAQGCQLVQLTSDATRTEAHRFYERLGFEATHVGFKLPL